MRFTISAFQRGAAIVLLLALASAAFPQTGKKGEVKERTVEGFVIDSAGKAMPGAIVQLKNVRTAQIRSFIAQNKGDFFFNGLSADVDYEIHAEVDGNVSQTKTISSYDGRKAFTVTLKLSNPK